MFRILIGLCILAASLADPVFEDDAPLPDGRIVGGQIVDIRLVPYQVSLQYNGVHNCGGSIYSINIIITAAHCFEYNKNTALWTVVAGSSKLNPLGSQSQVMRVQKISYNGLYHSKYKNNDVAVMFLKGQLRYNSFVQPIPLATKRPTPGTYVMVSGWGAMKEGGPSSNELRSVQLPVIDNVSCRNYYPELTNKMLCAGFVDGGKDSCQGDSGGPLFWNGELLGIVSFGEGCARRKRPGVYASVPDLINWIDDVIDNAYDPSNWVCSQGQIAP